eukprot:209076-Chlamydomonas_euryale.AAC.1
MPVDGQNSGHVDPLLVSREEFYTWVERVRGQARRRSARCTRVLARTHARTGMSACQAPNRLPGA